MALPVYRTSAFNQGGSAVLTYTITRPAGVLDTDYCVVTIAAGVGSNALVAPTGTQTGTAFDTIVADTVTNNSRMGVYGRVMLTDTTITISFPNAPTTGNNTTALATWYSGCSGWGTVGSVGFPTVAGTASTAPTITTSGPDRLVLVCAHNKGTSTAGPTTVSYSPDAVAQASRLSGLAFYPGIVVGAVSKPTQGVVAAQTATFDNSTVSQGAVLVSLLPTTSTLQVTGVMSGTGTPPAANVGVQRTLTLTPTGGNGNPITYGPVSWGDGSADSPAQSSNVFTHTPTAASPSGGSYTWSADWSQA